MDMRCSDLHRISLLHPCVARRQADRGARVPRSSRRKPLLHERLTARPQAASSRSEEHTSELQSLMRTSYAVFCLKNKKKTIKPYVTQNNKTKRYKQKQK